MRCVLGLDGGGTKTECVLMDEARKVLARSRSGPSNPLRVGFEAALAALIESAECAIRIAQVERNSVAGLCAGLAGAGRMEAALEMRAALATTFPRTAVKVCTDLELALAATGHGPAIVLVAGTGSAAIGRDSKGLIRRAGGYGPLLGDQGSAYDIGRRAIIGALLGHDRSGADSPLGSQILTQLGSPDWVSVQDRVRVSADDVFPRVFPVVAAAADAGDEAARAILVEAAREQAALVRNLAERLALLGTPFTLVKTGGTVGCSPFFDAELDMRLREAAPRGQIKRLLHPAAESAAHLALQLIAGAEIARE
jgi:N-acetylglucosamine kinase-like BadF-type ATPase